MPKVTIVMYHYVRDLKNSRYPEIKGLPYDAFKEQLRYIQKHYTVVRMEDVIDAIKKKKTLPDNSCLLTFDDGFADHFDFVFPALTELGMQGSFFPAARAIMEHEMLDVHKIHYIMASMTDVEQLKSDVNALLDVHREAHRLESNEYYYKTFAEPTRYDSADIVYIKSILQRAIDPALRAKFTDELFRKYVYHDPKVFAREIYMNIDQLRCLKRHGMFIGNHAWSHYWMDSLSREEQVKEIKLAEEFLHLLGCENDPFVFCYPYGGYNDEVLELLREMNCDAALSIIVDIADLEHDDPLLLARLDTNDLPRLADAPANEWTLKVAG